MTRNKYLTLAGGLFIMLVIGIWFASHGKNLVWQKMIHTENFGTISVAHPLFGAQEQVLAFVDTQKFDSKKLADQIAHLGAQAAIVDAELALKAFSPGSDKCLAPKQVAASLATLMKIIPICARDPRNQNMDHPLRYTGRYCSA